MRVILLHPPTDKSRNVIRDLVYGCWCKGRRIAHASTPPLPILLIGTILRDNGHQVEIIDGSVEGKSVEDVAEASKKFDAMIIPTSTTTFKEDVEFLGRMKNANPELKTIVFGSHVTFLPDASLKEETVDFIVMREPEYIIRDLIAALDNGMNFEKIAGIGFRKKGKRIINPPYPFIKDLDELPIPDRTLLPKIYYPHPLVKNAEWTTAITSRGCPGLCTFCTSPYFYGNTYRFRSAEKVVEELELLKKQGYKEVFFRDETFTASKDRLHKICDLLIERDVGIEWICNARIGNVDKELLVKMKKAGCHTIKFGVESGVQEILNNIRKGIKVDMTRKTFKWAHEVRIRTHAHTMVGCVGETPETIKKTIKFLKEIDPTTVTMGIFTPYPGTPLFKMVEKEVPEIGDGTSCDLTKIHTTPYYNQTFCKVPLKELERALPRVYRSFYLRPTYILKRLSEVRSYGDLRHLVKSGIGVALFAFEREDE